MKIYIQSPAKICDEINTELRHYNVEKYLLINLARLAKYNQQSTVYFKYAQCAQYSQPCIMHSECIRLQMVDT